MGKLDERLLIQKYLQQSSILKELLPDNWMFVAYDDAGPGWQESRELRCHCGKILRHRYTLQFVGPITDQMEFLSETDKEEITKQEGKVFFGETCFNHKILGLTERTSKDLTLSIRRIKNQAKHFSDDKVLKKALDAQRHLIKSLSYAKINVPESITHIDQSGLPLAREQMATLKKMYTEYQSALIVQRIEHSQQAARQQWENKDNQITPKPNNVFEDDPMTAEMMWRNFDELKETTKISAVDLAFNIDHESPNHYGYFSSSGKPRIYPDLILFLLEQERIGVLEIIDKSHDDVIFVKK